jgi:hypothetical protein
MKRRLFAEKKFKQLLVLVKMIYCQFSCGQTNNGSVKAAATDGVLKTTKIHSFSIEEPIIATFLSKLNILNQGFLQPVGKYYLFPNRDSVKYFTYYQ